MFLLTYYSSFATCAVVVAKNSGTVRTAALTQTAMMICRARLGVHQTIAFIGKQTQMYRSTVNVTVSHTPVFDHVSVS